MKVLIIDDDQSMLQLWETVFKKEGLEVISISLPKVGIDEAKNQKPDIILVDQIMPDMKGNDLLKILKEDPATKIIPVAIVSNYNDENLMREAIEIGAVDYILKYQVTPQDLVAKIKALSRSPSTSSLG